MDGWAMMMRLTLSWLLMSGGVVWCWFQLYRSDRSRHDATAREWTAK